MARLLLLLSVTLLTLLSHLAHSSPSELLVWTGAADGSTWNVSGNWKPTPSGYRVPGELTDIEINTATHIINVPAGWDGIISSINVQLGILMLNAWSSLTVNRDMTLYGALEMRDNSTLTIMGSFTATTAARRRTAAEANGMRNSGMLSLQNAKISTGTNAEITSFIVISTGNSIIHAPGGVQFAWTVLKLVGDSVYPCERNSSLFIEGFAHIAENDNRLTTYHRESSVKGNQTFVCSRFVVQDVLTISNKFSINVISQGSPSVPTPIVAHEILLDNPAINVSFSYPTEFEEMCQPVNMNHDIRPDNGAPGCYTANSGAIIVLLTDCNRGDSVGCAPGYSGAGCNTPICPGNCNGQGTCTSSYPSVPYCICNTGWTAAGDCSVPSCESYANCNGDHGTCVAAAPLPQCVCSPSWSGPTCATPVCNGCNAHQYCEGLVVPPACQCIAGWKGPSCDQPSTSSCSNDCSGHGTCDPTTATCKCDAQWGGLGCSASLCENNCSYHGVCNAQHGCECSAGYSGADCSQGSCAGGCKNGGVCLNSGVTPVCICKAGWYGNRCDQEVLSGTAPPEQKHHALTNSQKVMIISLSVGVAVLVGAALFFFRDTLRQALVCNAREDIPYSEFR